MSINVALSWDGIDASLENRDGSGIADQISAVYIVSGTTDDMVALRAAFAFAPEKRDNLVKSGASIQERATESFWKIRVDYASSSSVASTQSVSGGENFASSFSTSGGTQHVETSLSTITQLWDSKLYPSSPLKPYGRDYPGCIEPDQDGNPRGIDIPTAMFKFNEVHYFKSSKVNTAFLKKLAYATGRIINSKTFRGYEPGEVLFLGASGSQDGAIEEGSWTVTYEFAVQPNQSNVVIEGALEDITVPTKYGWDYLWKYIESRANAEGKVFKRTTGVFVERLFEPQNFSLLGI